MPDRTPLRSSGSRYSRSFSSQSLRSSLHNGCPHRLTAQRRSASPPFPRDSSARHPPLNSRPDIPSTQTRSTVLGPSSVFSRCAHRAAEVCHGFKRTHRRPFLSMSLRPYLLHRASTQAPRPRQPRPQKASAPLRSLHRQCPHAASRDHPSTHKICCCSNARRTNRRRSGCRPLRPGTALRTPAKAHPQRRRPRPHHHAASHKLRSTTAPQPFFGASSASDGSNTQSPYSTPSVQFSHRFPE
jgi:hypothetical protein